MSGNSARVLLTCYLPCSPELVASLDLFSAALATAGLRLVLLAPDNRFAAALGSSAIEFEAFPGGVAAFASPSVYVESELVDEYDVRLADVDANWGVIGDAASFQRSLAGVDACRVAARSTLSRLNPALALFWSAGMFPASRIWRDVAREMGITSFCIERGFLPGTWMVDQEGMNEQSDALINPTLRTLLLGHQETMRAALYRDWYCTHRPRKYAAAGQGASGSVTLPKGDGPIICAFGGLDTGRDGAGLGLRHSRGVRSAASIIAALNAVDIDPFVRILFKPHPGSASRVVSGVCGRVTVLPSDEDPIELMRVADLVVTASTSLAYEALLHDRPIVQTVLGPLKGVVPTALDADALGRCVVAALGGADSETARDERRRFIDALLSHYLFAVEPGVPARPLSDLVAHLASFADTPVALRGVADLDCAHRMVGDGIKSSNIGVPLQGVAYFDVGEGFREQCVHQWFFRPNTGIESRDIPVPPGTRAVRLDPADNCCVVRLLEASWIDSNAHVVSTHRGSELVLLGSESQIQLRQGPRTEDLDLVCTGDDPHVLLAIPLEAEGRLEVAGLTLRLTYNAWQLSAGVALRPEEIFGEVRVGTAMTTAAVAEVGERNRRQLEEIRGDLRDLGGVVARRESEAEIANRNFDRRLESAAIELQRLVADVLPAMSDESLSALEQSEARLCAGQQETYQRLNEVSRVVLTAKQELCGVLTSRISDSEGRLEASQDAHARAQQQELLRTRAELDANSRLRVDAATQQVLTAQRSMTSELSQVVETGIARLDESHRGLVETCAGELRQAGVELKEGLKSHLDEGVSSVLAQQRNVAADLKQLVEAAAIRLDDSQRSLIESQARDLRVTSTALRADIENHFADVTTGILAAQRDATSFARDAEERLRQTLEQLAADLDRSIHQRSSAQLSALQVISDTQQALLAEMLQTQQRIADDLSSKLSAEQEAQRRLTANLIESQEALALARTKLTLLASHVAIRLVRAVCRLPKDVFSV